MSPIVFDQRNNDDSGSGTKYEAGNLVIGSLLVFTAQWFNGAQFVIEEKLFKDYYLHPLKVVGWEGFWGSLMYIPILIILYFIPCSDHHMCGDDRENVEDIGQAFSEMKSNGLIMFYTFAIFFCVAAFNTFGTTVTKYSSSLLRIVFDVGRILVVWFTFCMLYIFDSNVGEKFLWMEVIGFIILVFSILVFNEIVVIPWWGFNKNLSKNRQVSYQQFDTLETDSEESHLLNSPSMVEQQYVLDRSRQNDHQLCKNDSVQTNSDMNRNGSF